ncbi:Uncharacterised protein [Mycobacterium tuberculosis]|nr:Uncharacterised protein [Mycobacterium tuberculosis]
MGREFVGAGCEVVFVEGFAGECGESAGAEFEFFAYGTADELVFGFLEDVADAAEHLGWGPGGHVPVCGLATVVTLVIAQRVGGGEGAVGRGEEPCEGEG